MQNVQAKIEPGWMRVSAWWCVSGTDTQIIEIQSRTFFFGPVSRCLHFHHQCVRVCVCVHWWKKDKEAGGGRADKRSRHNWCVCTTGSVSVEWTACALFFYSLFSCTVAATDSLCLFIPVTDLFCTCRPLRKHTDHVLLIQPKKIHCDHNYKPGEEVSTAT